MSDRNTIGGIRLTAMDTLDALERGECAVSHPPPRSDDDKEKVSSTLLGGLRRRAQSTLVEGRRAFAPAGTTLGFGMTSWQRTSGAQLSINDPRADCLPNEVSGLPKGDVGFRHPELVTSRSFLVRDAPLQSVAEPTMPGAWPDVRPELRKAADLFNSPSHSAKAWVQAQIAGLGQPEKLIKEKFSTFAIEQGANVSSDHELGQESNQEPTDAVQQLIATIRDLPFEHRWDVTRVLADVSEGDPLVAIQIARQMQHPLQLHTETPDADVFSAPPINQSLAKLTWKAAQKLAGTAENPGGVALDALLSLQGLRHEDDSNASKAGMLLVYLRATSKLATLQTDFSSFPSDAMNSDNWGDLVNNPKASLALDALRALKTMTIVPKINAEAPAAAQVTLEPSGKRLAFIDHDDYTVKIHGTQSELAAVVALLWSHDERGAGTEFTKIGALAYQCLTESVVASHSRPASDTWAAWVHDGVSFVKDALSRVPTGPLGLAAGKMMSLFGVPALDQTSAQTQRLGPGGAIYRTMPGLLGQDLDTRDKQRAAYDQYITETRDGLLTFCQHRLLSENDPSKLVQLALIAEQLNVWKAARPLDLPNTKPHTPQSPRPESFCVDALTAAQLWSQARARVESRASCVGPAVSAAALRGFDNNPIRREDFIKRLSTVGNGVPAPFSREALYEWIVLSGASQHDKNLDSQWHGNLHSAQKIAEGQHSLPLHRIDSSTLSQQWASLTDRTQQGTQYRSMKGGTVGVQFSVSLGVIPVSVAVTGLQSNTSGYAVGAENNGFAIRFEDERSRTLAGGLSGYGGVALADGLIGIGGSGGGALRGSSTQTRGALFRAVIPRRVFENDSAVLEQWRRDGKEMVNTLFQVAGEVKDANNRADDFADAFAAACIGKPTIQMASRSGNAANLVFVGSGSANVRVTPTGARVQPGIFGSVSATASLVDHALAIEQGASVASSSTFRTATSINSNIAAAMSVPTLSVGGHNPAAQRFAAITAADIGVTDAVMKSKVSSLYLARDSRGPIAPLMFRDTFYHDFHSWRASVEQNPTWSQGIGPERLAQYIEQVSAEYDGSTSLGERWSFRPESPQFASYKVHERIVETLKQDVAAATNPQRMAQAQDRLLAASEAMQNILNDPTALVPAGLFGIRNTQAIKTIGTGYMLRATESHTQSAVQLVNWEPYQATPTGRGPNNSFSA